MNHIATYIQVFFNNYLAVQRGLSVNTILAYRDTMKLLLCFTADKLKKAVDALTIEEIDVDCILLFLNHIETERGSTERTRNVRLAAIRTFSGFLGRQEPSLLEQCRKIRDIPCKRVEHKTAEYFDEKEIQALLDSVDKGRCIGIRDKALLLLLYNTGARVSEIVDLKIPDLRLDAAGQVKVMGKGRKERSTPLWPDTVEALREYLKQRSPRRCVEQRLFLNEHGIPITRFGVRYVIKKYAAIAQDRMPSIARKKVSPHTVRHSTAMHLIRSGNEINMVSYWLGHADLNTTHLYLEIDMEMKRKMLDKTDAPHVDSTQPWQKPNVLEWLSNLPNGSKLCEVEFLENSDGT